MDTRYVFTVTAGRSGQASLCEIFRRHVPGCYAAFEEPNARPSLPGALGDIEKRFRRRFVETHELLGRGKVLGAFERGDDAYLDRIAARRLAMIERTLARADCSINVDVSKYFARGLHRGFLRALDTAEPGVALIRLVRDPLLNMRSFLNRNKDFRLDNSLPEAASNLLRLDSAVMEKGELYLWAWCEMYLRFDRMADEFGIDRAVEIRTEHQQDPVRMAAALEALGLPHDKIVPGKVVNSNTTQGFGETRVGAGDIALFERFLGRLPADLRRRIAYFDDYDPVAKHAREAA